MNVKTKKLTALAMFCAIAYVMTFLAQLPIVPALPFLKYDPKDVMIAISGFLFGPVSALVVSAVTAVLEMLTNSATGLIGCVMNFLSSVLFAVTAAVFYRKNHTLAGAVAGLMVGCVLMTVGMLLWNYLITPLYMAMPRAEVAQLLLPAFLPFNLIKSGGNAALTLLLYKPVGKVVRQKGFAQESSGGAGNRSVAILLAVLLLAVAAALWIMVR